MAGRTFAIGDIHGELDQLYALLSCLPTLDDKDTLVFLGDYLDRGPKSRQVIEFLRRFLPNETPARVVTLRGNHEDAWLRVIRESWPGFVLPTGNGCLATLRSFTGGPTPELDEAFGRDEGEPLMWGTFFPEDVVAWMKGLPYFFENEHAIFVHAGLPEKDGRFLHPSEVEDKTVLLWIRTLNFFQNYRGKRVIVGHTTTATLPQELSRYTPDDPSDLWAGEAVIAIDTGCGQGGFLTAVELPGLRVYESRPGGARG